MINRLRTAAASCSVPTAEEARRQIRDKGQTIDYFQVLVRCTLIDDNPSTKCNTKYSTSDTIQSNGRILDQRRGGDVRVVFQDLPGLAHQRDADVVETL